MDSSSRTRTRLTRRGVVALAAVGLAGCTSASDESTDDGDDETESTGNGDDAGGNGGADHLDQVDPETPPAVDHAEFRAWTIETTAEDANRFEYTDAIPEAFGSDLPNFFDATGETVDGHLVQSTGQVLLGDFDARAIAEGAANDDAFDVTGTSRGYAVLEPDDRIDGPPAAVGADAIVIGEDVDRRLDARFGDDERLEETEPEFERLFEVLPFDGTVTGEAGPPTRDGLDLDEDSVTVWGVSSESPTAETMTWAFLFADEDALTEDVLEELETIPEDVTDSSIEGRIAIVEGVPPELSREE